VPQPAPQPQPAAGDGQGEAVFRLAASLDKVGARIEERMKSQFSTLRERLDSVQSGIENRQEALEARLEEFATAPAPAASHEFAPEQTPVQQAMPAPAPEPQVHAEVQPEPQPEIQWQAPSEPVAYEPPPAPVESPLGVLDMIEPDEPFAPLPDAAIQADFSHSQSLQGLHEVQPGGPVPALPETPAAGPWGGELQLNTPEASLSPEERERLLAETRLRQSLQNMQRNPGQNPQDFGV